MTNRKYTLVFTRHKPFVPDPIPGLPTLVSPGRMAADAPPALSAVHPDAPAIAVTRRSFQRIPRPALIMLVAEACGPRSAGPGLSFRHRVSVLDGVPVMQACDPCANPALASRRRFVTPHLVPAESGGPH